MQKFPRDFFTKTIDISDIRKRNESEQYAEIEEFYNMNNRQVFEKYGVYARNEREVNLIANSVILDSLLQGKYSEISDIYCYSPSEGYRFEIKLADGTEIIANSGEMIYNIDGKKGITIKKDGKEATVVFCAKSTGEKREVLTDIKDLEVENITYTGDTELIAYLQRAMQEQFKSQRQEKSQYDKYSEIADKLLEKAGVRSDNEVYELEGLSISLIDYGSTVLVKSDTLGISFYIDANECMFYDSDDLVKIVYHSKEKNPSHLVEEELSNEEIIEKIKKFSEKLEELTKDETPQQGENTDNSLLIANVINGGVKMSDVQKLQQGLIGAIKGAEPKDRLS